jgi:hypothetical protein
MLPVLQVSVCLFGSVPIMTYLPHGDIDLTFYVNGEASQDIVSKWPHRLVKKLERASNFKRHAAGSKAAASGLLNMPAGSTSVHHKSATPVACEVRSALIIPAEVTLIKCHVFTPQHSEDIVVVDISFQQQGGVNAVTFLEEADRYIDAYTLAPGQCAFSVRPSAYMYQIDSFEYESG